MDQKSNEGIATFSIFKKRNSENDNNKENPRKYDEKNIFESFSNPSQYFKKSKTDEISYKSLKNSSILEPHYSENYFKSSSKVR